MKAPPLTREPAAVPDLRRKCSCGDKTGCEECKAKAGRLDRRAVGPGTPGAVPPVVHEVLRSPGEPLDPAARAFFEPRFGHDFGRIRVHSGPRAAASAAAVNARAYTVGRHIVLGDPGPVPPTLLLAHELAHTVQQGDRAGDPA
ncbi:MAG: DUF4157 domain-containing protein, partial [Gemmataceae bacterium]|nr:DUF4157 domain-containing protein [Gemmataceae bacterium]